MEMAEDTYIVKVKGQEEHTFKNITYAMILVSAAKKENVLEYFKIKYVNGTVETVEEGV